MDRSSRFRVPAPFLVLLIAACPGPSARQTNRGEPVDDNGGVTGASDASPNSSTKDTNGLPASGGASGAGGGASGGVAGGGVAGAAGTTDAAPVRDSSTGDVTSANGPGINVTTQKYNNSRTGWNSQEARLTPTNVNMATFGKVFSRPVEGQIYAQPLVVSSVMVAGKTRNVVYVETTHNNIYAFDADDAAATMPLWLTKLGPSVPKGSVCSCNDVRPEVGAMSTPVIDVATKTLYAVSKHLENGAYVQRLNALDILTGAHKTGSPVAISASVPGTGDGAANGMIAFDSKTHLNRPGLLLQNGTVYMAFASHGDTRPYHGWVMAYDATTLRQTGVFNTSATGGQAGIWMSGNGLVGDDQGSVYFATGNGSGTGPTPLVLGEAMVKLGKDVKLLDWHICGNYKILDGTDIDYGMGGPLLIPNSGRIIMGGKDQWAFLYDKENLGKRADDTAVIQKFKGAGPAFAGRHSGGFIYWQGPMGPMVFAWPSQTKLLGFKFNGMKFDETPAVVGGDNGTEYSSGTMTISSNGPEGGVIWALRAISNPNQMVVPGRLGAFDAVTGKLLWESVQNRARDDLGMYASYSYPTVANGKVYAPSWTGSSATVAAGALQVYGLLGN